MLDYYTFMISECQSFFLKHAIFVKVW